MRFKIRVKNPKGQKCFDCQSSEYQLRGNSACPNFGGERRPKIDRENGDTPCPQAAWKYIKPADLSLIKMARLGSSVTRVCASQQERLDSTTSIMILPVTQIEVEVVEQQQQQPDLPQQELVVLKRTCLLPHRMQMLLNQSSGQRYYQRRQCF